MLPGPPWPAFEASPAKAAGILTTFSCNGKDKMTPGISVQWEASRFCSDVLCGEATVAQPVAEVSVTGQ